ncbi:hypothetical protein GCM10022252_78030 [Streptosporangium oxazolinicum]|uniref:Uncharacterized protein n=1 Tax=Streptosporangium oxazolinicum TaxID=909287 RepID=A0ABP8BNK3_9ACTN
MTVVKQKVAWSKQKVSSGRPSRALSGGASAPRAAPEQRGYQKGRPTAGAPSNVSRSTGRRDSRDGGHLGRYATVRAWPP